MVYGESNQIETQTAPHREQATGHDSPLLPTCSGASQTERTIGMATQMTVKVGGVRRDNGGDIAQTVSVTSETGTEYRYNVRNLMDVGRVINPLHGIGGGIMLIKDGRRVWDRWDMPDVPLTDEEYAAYQLASEATTVDSGMRM